MTILQRLSLLGILVLSPMIGLSLLSAFSLNTVYAATNVNTINVTPNLTALSSVLSAFAKIRAQTWQHIAMSYALDDRQDMDDMRLKIKASRADLEKILEGYQKSSTYNDEDRKLLVMDRAALAEYDKLVENILDISEVRRSNEAHELTLTNQNVIDTVQGAIEKHIQFLVNIGINAERFAEQTRKSALLWNYVLVAVSIMIMVAAIIWILRGLLHQLGGEPAHLSEVADKVARGDLSGQFVVRFGDNSSAMSSLQRMVDAIRLLVVDTDILSAAAVEGKLETRADTGKHQGAYRKIIQGVNGTLDAVIGPLDVAADYVNRIAHGDIPPKIAGTYNGDFNAIKDNLNTAIDAVNALLADTNRLSLAAIEGQLETRADASKHHGDFRRIIEGVNTTLDTVIGSVKDVMRVLAALREGDLTQKITNEYSGMFGHLKHDLNQTIENLHTIVSQIHNATGSIHIESRTIAMGNNDLSGRTEQQAASIGETAASMDALTVAVKQNAENAKQANHLALDATDIAVNSGFVVKQAVATMNQISTSSRKIADIIGIIDGLAFQTNILALNAAVEAARAGEQGRGFSVVASEVRSLAQRSAASAREIKILIEDSVSKVTSGSRLIDETGMTMDTIVASIKHVTDIIGEITIASQEQSSGIEQINRAISHMDETTHQNSALVEQTAAASKSLEEHSCNMLSDAIRVFKLSVI